MSSTATSDVGVHQRTVELGALDAIWPFHHPDPLGGVVGRHAEASG